MERELSDNELDAVSGGLFGLGVFIRNAISVMQCEQSFTGYNNINRTVTSCAVGGTGSLAEGLGG